MSLIKLFEQLKTQLTTDSPQRNHEKSNFIENRMGILQDLNLNEQSLSSKIAGYLGYSSQGVFNSLAFNENLNEKIKLKTLEQITTYSFMYNLKTEEINFPNNNHTGVKAYYDENLQPKIAVICTGNIGSQIVVTPFADIEELQTILKKSAIDDCLSQFKFGQMDSATLVGNIIELSPTKDIGFRTLLQGVNYDLNSILLPLKLEFNLEAQLDKLFRNPKEENRIEETLINQLDLEGSLESYQKTRINKNSILPEAAQHRLMEALDTFSKEKLSNNIKTPINLVISNIDTLSNNKEPAKMGSTDGEFKNNTAPLESGR